MRSDKNRKKHDFINNVIFDLDGTLVDTSEGVTESVRYAIDKMGFSPLSDEVLLTFVGPPLKVSFMKYCNCSEEDAREAIVHFRKCYSEGALFRAKPYEGIIELCDRLKKNDIRLAVATYKLEEYALQILEHFELSAFFLSAHGADKGGFLKKEDIIRISMREMGGTQADTVLVGDTENDAVGAGKAGVSFIAVTYGFGFREEADLNGIPNAGISRTPSGIGDIVLGDRL